MPSNTHIKGFLIVTPMGHQSGISSSIVLGMFLAGTD
jgi:hypothetical protein